MFGKELFLKRFGLIQIAATTKRELRHLKDYSMDLAWSLRIQSLRVLFKGCFH